MGNSINDFFVPEILEASISTGLAGMRVFLGSSAVILNTSLLSQKAGDKVKVPYFNTLGEAEEVASTSDDSEGTVDTIGSDNEEALVYQYRKVIDVTAWARASQGVDDPYPKMVQECTELVMRGVEKRLITNIFTDGTALEYDGGTSPLDGDMVVDAQTLFDGEGADVAMMVVHPKIMGSLRKLKDDNGRPLLTDATQSDPVRRFCGAPLIESKLIGVDTAAWSAVTEAGTSPPDLTLSGTPNNTYDLRVEITTAGARGTAKFKYSLNGGKTWSKIITTANTYEMPGTGTTLNFATGTNYATDNVYTATSTASVYRTAICKPGSMVAWLNGSPQVFTNQNHKKPSYEAGIHVWAASHVYRSMPGKTLPGVAIITHGISS